MHIAGRHQQLLNTVAVAIRLADDTAFEIHIDIRDQLFAGEDSDSFRSKVVSVRSITFAD
jgi:hypothetical protein